MQAVLVVEVSFGQVQPCLDAVEPFDIDSVAEVGRLVAVAPSLVGQPFVGVVEAVVGVVASFAVGMRYAFRYRTQLLCKRL